MIVECSICNKSFANKGSLYSHKYRYHPNMDKTSNGEKNSTFVDHRYENQSDESDSENEVDIKRRKTKKSINEEFIDEIVQKLVQVLAKLIKDMDQVHATFSKLDKDMDKVEDQINENKRSITKEKCLSKLEVG